MRKLNILFIFIAFTVLFLSGVLFSGKIFFFRDILNLFHPYRVFAAENIQSGILPLWNPYTFFGQPFLANPETSLFYPFTIFFYIFSFPFAYKLFLAVHFFLGSFLFYLLAQTTERSSSFAVMLAATAWGFGGYLSARIEFLSILGAAIWLPIVMLFLKQNRTALLALVFAAQIFAGHPQVFFYSAILCLFFLNKDNFSVFIYAAALALLITAVQVIPFSEFAINSNRAGGLTYEEASSSSISLGEIFRHLFPQKTIDITGNYWLKSIYIGILPLIFFLISLFNTKKAVLTAFICVTILALGRYTPIYWIFYEYLLPFSKIRYPSAITILFVFLMCFMISTANLKKISKYGVLILLLVFADLYIYSTRLNPLMDYKLLSSKTENTLILQREENAGRFLVLSDVYYTQKNFYDFINNLPTNTNIPHHLLNADGYDPITTRGIEEKINEFKKNPNAKLLASYGITHLISAKNPGKNWIKIKPLLYRNKLKSTLHIQTQYPGWIIYTGECKTEPIVKDNIFLSTSLNAKLYYMPFSVIIGILITIAIVLVLIFLSEYNLYNEKMI